VFDKITSSEKIGGGSKFNGEDGSILGGDQQFEKVYKNDTYKRKPKEFFDKLKQDEQKEESVQGFLCPWCGKSFHMEKRGGLPCSHKG